MCTMKPIYECSLQYYSSQPKGKMIQVSIISSKNKFAMFSLEHSNEYEQNAATWNSMDESYIYL